MTAPTTAIVKKTAPHVKWLSPKQTTDVPSDAATIPSIHKALNLCAWRLAARWLVI